MFGEKKLYLLKENRFPFAVSLQSEVEVSGYLEIRPKFALKEPYIPEPLSSLEFELNRIKHLCQCKLFHIKIINSEAQE